MTSRSTLGWLAASELPVPVYVDVAARIGGIEPVVGGVVDAAEREHRAAVVALGGVVVDDVEDDLDPGPVERLHHPLELAHLLAEAAGRRVERVGGEEADRRVAPVVRQPALVEELLVGDVVDRQQLDRGDAERAQVGDRLVGGETGVGAAEILAHCRIEHREPLDVRLVDHRLGPRRLEADGRPPSRTTGRSRRTSGSPPRRPRGRGRGRPPVGRVREASARRPSEPAPRSPSRTGRSAASPG